MRSWGVVTGIQAMVAQVGAHAAVQEAGGLVLTLIAGVLILAPVVMGMRRRAPRSVSN